MEGTTRPQFYMSYGPVQKYKATAHKPYTVDDFCPDGDPLPISTLLSDLRQTVSTTQAIFRLVQIGSPFKHPFIEKSSPFWIKAWAEDGSAAPVARTG
jgi:hypothetical protein